MVDWNTVSGVANLYRLVKEIFQDTSSYTQESQNAIDVPPVKEPKERYQVTLGRRHKLLRESILDLNPREMSDFYGFEKVSFLEDCEAGLDEFPTDSIKRLVEVFFIRPKYLQESQSPIFQNFNIISTQEDCIQLLSQEYNPYFLCGPNFSHDGEAYLVFWKQEQEYWRMIRSNARGGFYSLGGGAKNVHNLIDAMLDLSIDPHWSNISFLNVGSEEWEKLKEGCWYNKEMRGYSGAANHEARDIFEDWYKSHQQRRER